MYLILLNKWRYFIIFLLTSTVLDALFQPRFPAIEYNELMVGGKMGGPEESSSNVPYDT